MKNKQKALKHHYIPQYYLKGFCDDDNLFVYNKKYNQVSKSSKKPAQIFYEKELHTVQFFGKKSQFIEEAYSKLEEGFSKALSKIKTLSFDEFGELVEHDDGAKILMLMLSVQFWRNPINSDLAKVKSEILLTLFDEAVPFNFEVLPVSRKDIKYFYHMRKEESVLKFIQFFILPLITFKLDRKLPAGFQIISMSEQGYKKDLVCTDCPVFFDELTDKFDFSGRVYFPLSKDVLLIKDTTPYNFNNIQKLMISNSKEKVVASSRSLLEELCVKIT